MVVLITKFLLALDEELSSFTRILLWLYNTPPARCKIYPGRLFYRTFIMHRLIERNINATKMQIGTSLRSGCVEKATAQIMIMMLLIVPVLPRREGMLLLDGWRRTSGFIYLCHVFVTNSQNGVLYRISI